MIDPWLPARETLTKAGNISIPGRWENCMGDNGKVTKERERGGRKRARVRVEQTLWIEIIKGDWNYMEMFCSSVSAWQSCITSSSGCSTGQMEHKEVCSRGVLWQREPQTYMQSVVPILRTCSQWERPQWRKCQLVLWVNKLGGHRLFKRSTCQFKKKKKKSCPVLVLSK